jgi:transaldolase / glucose-6-phosphate isomerase
VSRVGVSGTVPRSAGRTTNPILDVQRFGQSIWYDDLGRTLVASGRLAGMVREGLRGVTSNPAIFEKRLGAGADSDPALEMLVRQGVEDAQTLYEQLAVEEIRLAADVLQPVYDATQGADGYISFEVSPHLAGDTAGTIEEGRRLHRTIGRENVMIKVPATAAGIRATAALISEGININVTLLFALDAYDRAAEAYMNGLERLLAHGGDPARVAGVASFFLSRIDTLADETMRGALEHAGHPGRQAVLESLMGRVAIANAKLAYARYRTMVRGARWQALAARGAQPQRLLWASTGTKNPRYSTTRYVEALIGPETVATLPDETYIAFRTRGLVRPTLTRGVDTAWETLGRLEAAGLSLHDMTDRLLEEAVEQFARPYDRLLSILERKRQAIVGRRSGSRDPMWQQSGRPAAAEAEEPTQ